MTQSRHDLGDRLIDFAVRACQLAGRLPASAVGHHVSNQLVRSVTSPFANYAETLGVESRRDFVHKLGICLKELRETKAWLRFIGRLGIVAAEDVEALLQECDQLLAIVATSIRTARANARGRTQNVQRPLIIEH